MVRGIEGVRRLGQRVVGEDRAEHDQRQLRQLRLGPQGIAQVRLVARARPLVGRAGILEVQVLRRKLVVHLVGPFDPGEAARIVALQVGDQRRKIALQTLRLAGIDQQQGPRPGPPPPVRDPLRLVLDDQRVPQPRPVGPHPEVEEQLRRILRPRPLPGSAVEVPVERRRRQSDRVHEILRAVDRERRGLPEGLESRESDAPRGQAQREGGRRPAAQADALRLSKACGHLKILLKSTGQVSNLIVA